MSLPPRSLACAATCLALVALGSAAWAHPVSVDGDPSDWLARLPGVDGGYANLGEVMRTGSGGGEWAWVDAVGDARQDIANPETDADLTAVRITGSPAGLFVLARFAPSTNPNPPVELQVALDLDRAPGNGQAALGGYADTTVAALWEFLLRTQFAAGTAPLLVDAAFQPVPGATPAASRSADAMELFVPWSNLGLTGPPTGPIRFTVASFRELPGGNTAEIPTGTGAVTDGTSDALDAVTNDGAADTRLPDGGAPNTWAEVSDGQIDGAFDVWFDPQGEVYAPLVVDRFVANSPSGSSDEWVTVRNVSPLPLALDAFKLGDAELPTRGEGMYLFPAGATLAAGARYTVAKNGAAYQAHFGSAPDAELNATGGGLPLMTKYGGWSTGSWGLGNTGDEVVLLDAFDTLVDVVAFGNSGYQSVVPYTPAPGPDGVLGRNAAGVDTDDCTQDLYALSPAGAGCAGCTEAIAGFCTPSAQATACSDGNACTGGDVCDGRGACVGGPAPSCDDGQVCTADACNPATGCVHTPVMLGTACGDGDACDGDEACDGLGACAPGAPLDCDDGNPCTADACDAVGGCTHAPVAADTPCDDGTVCDGREVCDGAGQCQPGMPLDCDDGNPCTADACDPVSGCASADLDAGAPCDDGTVCDGREVCDGAGQCQPGTPLHCDDGNACTADACDPAAGCAHDAAALDGQGCGADACGSAESCAAGACVPIAPTVCPATDACHQAALCDPETGACGAGDALADGTPCDGGACEGGVCSPKPVTTASSSGGGTTAGGSSGSSGDTTGWGSTDGAASASTGTSTAGGTGTGGAHPGASTGLSPPPTASSGTTGTRGAKGSGGGCGSAGGGAGLSSLALGLLLWKRRRA